MVGVPLPETLILGRDLQDAFLKTQGAQLVTGRALQSETQGMASPYIVLDELASIWGKLFDTLAHHPKTTTSGLKIFVFENKTYTRKYLHNFVVEKCAEETKSTGKGCSFKLNVSVQGLAGVSKCPHLVCL